MFLREKLEDFAKFKTLYIKLQNEKFGFIGILSKSEVIIGKSENYKVKSFYNNIGI